jgi:bifunctional enzyme CysN/CysC
VLPNMTGVGQNYEPPDEPDLVVNGSGALEETVTRLTRLVAGHP